MTKREYLRSLGFTVGERGRFSAEQTAALAAAPAGTITEPVVEAKAPKAPKTVKVVQPIPAPAPKVDVNPKDVRSWAKQNGYEVGERGRIHGDVVTAFLNAGGKARVLAPSTRPTPLDMPKRRPEASGFSRVGGILVRQDRCGGCSAAVNRCACATGPQAYKFLSKEAGKTVLLSLDKPSL